MPLSIADGSASVFDPSRLDWREGLLLADREHSWSTTLSKRAARVMVTAKPFGFDGFVEQSQLPQEKAFYLLAREEHAEVIRAWGHNSCEGFSEVSVQGLPAMWRLYKVEQANSDLGIRDAFPYLAFATVLRIRFIGGLRVKGNQYFTFALPQIEVTGAVEGASVFCNDHALDRDPETGLYSIPDSLCARRLVVEIKRNNERIRSRSIYSVETVEWREIQAATGLDKFGCRVDDGASERCCGPIVHGATPPPPFDPGTFLPPGAGHRIYFIGRNPGEIIQCPEDVMPSDWRPIWAVPMQGRNKCSVVYCGTNPVNEAPGTVACTDRRRRRLWKDILWYRRKQINPPSHPALCSLWRQYRGVAEHVR